MELNELQKDLDRVKWDKSVALGIDACGTFDYCRCCEKHLDNPCARALNRMNGTDIPQDIVERQEQLPVEIEEKPLVEVEEKPLVEVKAPAKKAATTKKAAAKKTTAKKAPAKKTTTKKTTATKKTTTAKKTTAKKATK